MRVTSMRLAAPIEAVWDRIYDWENWPSWWKGVARTEKAPATPQEKPEGPEGQVGTVEWRSPLGYSLLTRMRLEYLAAIERLEIQKKAA